MNIQNSSTADYLLLIEPRQDLADTITGLKRYFSEKYKIQTAINSKPHITLVKFAQFTSLQEKICHKLRLLSISKAPFIIELLDYGSFPSHTIFINILSRMAIQNLVKYIRTDMQFLMKLNRDDKPHFILEPHLTIAQKLLPWQYEQGWMEFSHKNFSGKFIASSMLLLRKEADAERYKFVERFEFHNIPIAAKQATLF